MRSATASMSALALSMAFVTATVTAQTPSSELRTASPPNVGPAAFSANNPYLGSQIGYLFDEGNNFVDGMLASVAFSTAPDRVRLGQIRVPFLANIDVGEILGGLGKEELSLEEARKKIESVAATRRGAVGGVYPYWELGLNDQLGLTLHGMAGYKGNMFAGRPAAGEADKKTWLHQGRVSAGAELRYSTSGRPLTIGLAPAYHFFSGDTYSSIFGEERSSLFVWETHAVVPIPGFNRLALLVEGVFGGEDVFADESISGVRAGLLFVKPLP